MNIEMLKVMNELYGLGMTAEDYKYIEDLRKKSSQKCSRIVCKVMQGNVLLMLCANGRTELKLDSNTWRAYAKIKRGDEIFMQVVVRGLEIPEYLYVLQRLHDKDHLNSSFNGDKVFTSIKALEKHAIEALRTKTFEQLGIFDENNKYGDKIKEELMKKRLELEKEQISALCKLFEEEYEEPDLSKARFNVPIIFRAIGKDNHRLALIAETQSRTDSVRTMMFSKTWEVDRVIYYYMILDHQDNRYDYTAPRRELIEDNNGFQVWVADDFNTISSEDLYIYADIKTERHGGFSSHRCIWVPALFRFSRFFLS